jgi:hypothetical protein
VEAPRETVRSVRSDFDLPIIARVLPGLETKHAYGRALEILASFAPVST